MSQALQELSENIICTVQILLVVLLSSSGYSNNSITIYRKLSCFKLIVNCYIYLTHIYFFTFTELLYTNIICEALFWTHILPYFLTNCNGWVTKKFFSDCSFAKSFFILKVRFSFKVLTIYIVNLWIELHTNTAVNSKWFFRLLYRLVMF